MDLQSGLHISFCQHPLYSESATSLVIISLPCNRSMFSGTDDIDVEDWLNLYEWISARNSWDCMLMLAKINFLLKRYGIREAELTNWDVCKAMLLHFFGNPVGCQVRAEKELASCALACHEKKKKSTVSHGTTLNHH